MKSSFDQHGTLPILGANYVCTRQLKSLWEKPGQHCTSIFKEEDTVPSLAELVTWLNKVRPVCLAAPSFTEKLVSLVCSPCGSADSDNCP